MEQYVEATPHAALKERSILVVEDELLVALDLEDLLAFAGARVLGPVGTVAGAMAIIDQGPASGGNPTGFCAEYRTARV
jgi:hypothetical protein